MADVLRASGPGTYERLKDMLDGTHARVTSTSGAGSGGSTVIQPSGGAVTNRSGTITTGGTAQQLAAANTARRYLLIQNVSAGNLWVNFTTTAVQDQPSFKLVPESSLVMEGSFVSTEAVSIIGATTGQQFTAKEG